MLKYYVENRKQIIGEPPHFRKETIESYKNYREAAKRSISSERKKRPSKRKVSSTQRVKTDANWLLGNIVYDFKEFPLSERKILSKDTLQTEEENRVLQLCTNGISSTYSGGFPAVVGSRPITTHSADIRASEYVFKTKFDWAKIGCLPPYEYSQPSGGWDTNFKTLEKQLSTGASGRLIDEEFIASIEPVIFEFCSKLRLKNLNFPHKHRIDEVKIKPDTYPGVRDYHFCKRNTKREACYYARKRAFADYHRIINGIPCERVAYFAIGARNQRNKNTFFGGGKAKSRVVHMAEMHREIITSLFLKPVSDLFKIRGTGPIYIGNSIANGQWRRQRDDIHGAHTLFETDVNAFDASQEEQYMILSLATSLACYEPDSKILNLFSYLCSSMINRIYVCPGGEMYKTYGGFSSGKGDTTLSTSLANFWRICHTEYYFHKNKKSKDFKILVGGDDTLLSYSKPGFVVDGNIYRSHVEEEYGQVIDSDFKISKNLETEGIDEKCSFYKYCIYKDEPHISSKNLYQRLMSPMASSSNSFNYFNFLKSLRELPQKISNIWALYIGIYCNISCSLNTNLDYSSLSESLIETLKSNYYNRVFLPNCVAVDKGNAKTPSHTVGMFKSSKFRLKHKDVISSGKDFVYNKRDATFISSKPVKNRMLLDAYCSQKKAFVTELLLPSQKAT